MTLEVLTLVGTLSAWLSIAFFLRSVFLVVSAWVEPVAESRAASRRAALGCLAIGAILVILSSSLPHPGQGNGGGLAVPLIWVIMPASGWLAAAFLVSSLIRIAQALGDTDAPTRRRHVASAGIAIALSLGSAGWMAFTGDSVVLLKGSIRLDSGQAAAIVILLASTAGLMAWAARSARFRGATAAVATYVALTTGSVVFGLPFAWLLITSFKEDRDMASPEGIVWIPRVQQTVPYLDPNDPLIETQFRGVTVHGTIVERLPDGSAKIEIDSPAVMRSLYCVARPPLKEVPKQAPLVTGVFDGVNAMGMVVRELEDGRRTVQLIRPSHVAGRRYTVAPSEVTPLRKIGLRWQNYPEALDFLPEETLRGLVYLKNTLVIVILNVLGTLFSSAVVAYAFARMRFPGRDALFVVLLSTMMLPAAVTLLPQFLIFRFLGWIDTLNPLWAPAWLGSAFNIFLLRQFFRAIPMELEDAAKIDGCSYPRALWQVMLPLVKPALAVVTIGAFMAAWNNFMGPLVYINSPENMPVSYALQLFQGDRSGEPGLLMAFATLSILPVVLVFFFAQKYFIEGVALTGLGGR